MNELMEKIAELEQAKQRILALESELDDLRKEIDAYRNKEIEWIEVYG